MLERSTDYTPALKGLGDVHLAMAKDAHKQVLDGRVTYHIQQALVHLVR